MCGSYVWSFAPKYEALLLAGLKRGGLLAFGLALALLWSPLSSSCLQHSSLRSRAIATLKLRSCLLLLRSLCSLRIFTAFIFARCIFAPLSICYDSVLKHCAHSLCSLRIFTAFIFARCIFAPLSICYDSVLKHCALFRYAQLRCSSH
jgi:hypothetical protein